MQHLGCVPLLGGEGWRLAMGTDPLWELPRDAAFPYKTFLVSGGTNTKKDQRKMQSSDVSQYRSGGKWYLCWKQTLFILSPSLDKIHLLAIYLIMLLWLFDQSRDLRILFGVGFTIKLTLMHSQLNPYAVSIEPLRILKQACCAGCRRRPFPMQLH